MLLSDKYASYKTSIEKLKTTGNAFQTGLTARNILYVISGNLEK